MLCEYSNSIRHQVLVVFSMSIFYRCFFLCVCPVFWYWAVLILCQVSPAQEDASTYHLCLRTQWALHGLAGYISYRTSFLHQGNRFFFNGMEGAHRMRFLIQEASTPCWQDVTQLYLCSFQPLRLQKYQWRWANISPNQIELMLCDYPTSWDW